jgi:hypothetical protein
MKRIVFLIAFLAAVALCAGAQTTIDFHQMYLATTPTPMPDYYPDGVNLSWDNFFYVTPGGWKGAGPGFMSDPSLQHNTVAFVGGSLCPAAASCVGSIKVTAKYPSATPVMRTFTPLTIEMCGGWKANTVTINAYNNSKFLGQWTVKLTTMPQTFTFPSIFPEVTQLFFAPGLISSSTSKSVTAGSVVIYKMQVMMH